MLCSGLPRNIFVISGVLISHVFVLLLLLSGPDIEVSPSVPGVLMVNLSGTRSPLPVRKKSSTTPPMASSLNAKTANTISSDESGVSGYGKEIGHSADGAARSAIHSPKPHYPLASRQLREQGLVIVKLCVNEWGIVNQVSLIQSSGFQGLDNSALKTLALWRFAPIKSTSISPSAQCFQSPVQFTLEV